MYNFHVNKNSEFVDCVYLKHIVMSIKTKNLLNVNIWNSFSSQKGTYLMGNSIVARWIIGLEIDDKLSWNKHIDKVAKKVASGIGAIRKICDFVDQKTLIYVYHALINPHFDYCSEVWDTIGVGLSNRLQKLKIELLG